MAKPWAEPRDFGRWTMPYTEVMFATELDFLLGLGVKRSAWGFRTSPEASLQDASFLWSTGEDRGRLSYAGTFRRPGSRAAFHLDTLASGIERTNFFGYGNETEKPDSKSEYRTLESFLAVTPSVRFERSRRLQVDAGATVRVSDTPGDRPNVLNEVEAYGRGGFAEAGLRAGVHYDSRGIGEGLLSGGLFETVGQGAAGRADLRVEAAASWFPAWLDVEDAFGAVEGLRGYYVR